MRLFSLIAGMLLACSVLAQSTHKHALPFLTPASNIAQQGFVRIINRSSHAGAVRIHAIDDTGERFGPVSLQVGAEQSTHFNSQDLETGNAAKGLSGGVGDGAGNWYLELETALDIHALAYLRTPDGFLTEMYSVVPRSADGRYRVLFFNPASNQDLVSRLRIINPHPERNALTIRAIDDGGVREREPLRFAIPASAVKMHTSSHLESRFGDGKGKWQLDISATMPVWVMSLMTTRSGHISNLSAPPPELGMGMPEPSAGPDLVVRSPSVNDESVNTGQSITLSVQVHNQGSTPSAATTLRYYRSSDATVTTSDTQVGTDAVSVLEASGHSAESVSLSAPSSAGTYYYGACVDTVEGEADTANNCSQAVGVTVQEPEADRAPANAAALYSRVEGRKIVVSESNTPFAEYRLTSTSRFTARYLADGLSLGGRWTYTKGPLHQGTVRLNYDPLYGVDVGSCSVDYIFTSHTSGRFSADCSSLFLVSVDGTFQIVGVF